MKESNTPTNKKQPKLLKTTQMADIVNNSPVPAVPEEYKKAEVMHSSGVHRNKEKRYWKLESQKCGSAKATKTALAICVALIYHVWQPELVSFLRECDME